MAPSRIQVNSLHGQGIDRLADRLAVEALAEDGTIEAVSMPDAPGFVLAVQWHPEWQVLENPWSRRLFAAFGAAARARASAGRAQGEPERPPGGVAPGDERTNNRGQKR